MKKVTFLLILVASLAIAAFFSCQKETAKYSCDPKIDKFVMSNLDNFTDISWQTLITYSEDTARAIYISLSPENKMNIWIEKFVYMMDNDSLNADEIAFLQSVIDALNPDLFEENAEGFETFTNWVNTNAQNVGWDDSKIGLSFGTVFTVINPGVASNGCNCAYDSINSCWGTCGAVPDCRDNPQPGCGWLWIQDCTGICS